MYSIFSKSQWVNMLHDPVLDLGLILPILDFEQQEFV